MKRIRNQIRSHAEMLCLSISALYSKQRDHQTLRAARRLRMTDEMSSRSVSTPVIPQCLYAGYRSFLLRPIPRIQTLRNDEAAGVRGFTLVELLVVVLIIGILSAIAIPMYQGAVDKSHWSTMLPASKAIKDAEEAFKMTNGEYSDTMEHLDVQISNDDLTFTLNTPNNLADPNVIRVTNSKLGDDVRLASYLDDSPLFAGQLHCEAKNEGSIPNERGQRLCEKLLNGQYLKTTDDGYTRYLLDQAINASTCKAATASWSTSKMSCYNTTAERCTDLGMDVVAGMDDQCGYENGYRRQIGEEGVCVGSIFHGGNGSNGCAGSTINSGGKCIAQGNASGCTGITVKSGGVCEVEKDSSGCGDIALEQGSFCISSSDLRRSCTGSNLQGTVICNGAECGGNYSLFNGGVCIANVSGACALSTYNNGSICYGNMPNTCGHSSQYAAGWPQYVKYDETSCCCGTYCPSYAPKCSDVGKTCDPQYMK